MIEVAGLRKTFRQGSREVHALQGVDLRVPAGTIHGIIGQSGAGKSTLVRCLTLLERPTAGRVAVGGTDLAGVSDTELLRARRRIGMVFQHANLFDSRTALGNVAYPLEVTGVGAAERAGRARELLALVGLEGFEDTHPARLSGGQRQRVGIARALASDPDVLLCDEPTSALDPASTAGVLDLIRGLSERLGLTVLVITHEMHVVKRLCHSVSLLEDGRISQSGPIVDVAADLGSPLSAALLPLPEVGDGAGTVLEVLARGADASRPLAALAPELGAPGVEILAGSVEPLGGERFAHQLLRLPADAPGTAEEILTRLRAAGVAARVRTPTQARAAGEDARELGGVL